MCLRKRNDSNQDNHCKDKKLRTKQNSGAVADSLSSGKGEKWVTLQTHKSSSSKKKKKWVNKPLIHTGFYFTSSSENEHEIKAQIRLDASLSSPLL